MEDEAFICLTDMIRGDEGKDHIRNWMRSRNTVEFLGLWETIHNPNFKGVEFDTFKSQAGLNSFNLTPQKWIEATAAKGLISKAGRMGGTYGYVSWGAVKVAYVRGRQGAWLISKQFQAVPFLF